MSLNNKKGIGDIIMNNENMTIKIITEEAKEIDANVISIFEIKETGNKYAIYTFNEEDAQGLVKIYASGVIEQDGLYTFESISDATEWTKIKDVMKDTAKEKSNYIANGDIKLISASSIKRKMNEPISVKLSETKAAKIGPNYKTGISNNYLNNVVDEEPQGTGSSVNTIEEPVVMPEVETQQPQTPVTPEPVTPKIEPEVKVSPLPQTESKESTPRPTIDKSAEVETPKVTVVPTPTFDLPQTESKKPKYQDEDVELPAIPKFEAPEVEDSKDNFKSYEMDVEPVRQKEQPNVDSILNKASYYQNIEEPKKEENKENIIQTIGLEFMRKVSELAEYEKELNNKNRELEARERVLSKIEKEIINKENRQKYILQTTKDKELELKKKDRELSEKEADLNRRILEFNKKISMFQQTFETISPVD